LGEAAAAGGKAEGGEGRAASLPALVRMARSAGARLLSARASAALDRIPDAFGETLNWCGLECRLDGDDRVDVMVSVSRGKARSLVEQMNRQPWQGDWRPEADWLRGWAAGASPAPYVWFELDLPHAGEGAMLFFVPFEQTIGQSPPGDHVELVAIEAQLISDGALSAETEAALRRVVGHLPQGGWPLHIASLRSRGLDGCRLVVSVPAVDAVDYLARIGWPGWPDLLRRLLSQVARFGSHVNLSFDVAAPSVGARLGLDCFFPTPPASDRRWQPVLDVLRAAGARPQLLEAFAGWYGEADTPEGPVFRNPFVKLILEGRQQPNGKAYLAFRPAFQPSTSKPGVRTAAMRRGLPIPRP
jgi:hypothetical protein